MPTDAWNKRNDELNAENAEIFALIKSCGYRVFIREQKHGFANQYCFYTDGTRIGYAQWSDYRFSVGSVHKANRTTGTGFSVAGAINRDTLKDALYCHAPGWASDGDRASVKKFASWEEFHNKDKFTSELVEV